MPDGSGRPFGMNAGSYADASIETLTADGSVTAAGVAAAMLRIAERQAQSATFIQEHGADVVDGHAQVISVAPPSIGGAGS